MLVPNVMERQIPFARAEDLFAQIREDGINGLKRNPIEDARTLISILEQRGFTFNIQQRTKIPDIPTLIVANHYLRAPLSRLRQPIMTRTKALSTSAEVILTTSVIVAGMENFTNRKVTWFQKGEINPSILGFQCVDRESQQAFLSVYDSIPVFKNSKTLQTTVRLIRSFRNGGNVILYPEGSVRLAKPEGIKYIMHPGSLREFNRSLSALVEIVVRNGFQVVPVSAYSKGKEYFAVFHEPIKDSTGTSQQAELIVTKVQSALPKTLHGYYRGGINIKPQVQQ